MAPVKWKAHLHNKIRVRQPAFPCYVTITPDGTNLWALGKSDMASSNLPKNLENSAPASLSLSEAPLCH